MPRDAPSSDRVLLPPEGRREPRPHAAPGRRPLPGRQRGLPLLPADLADQRVEHIVDVVAVGGGRLEEGAAELAGQSQPFLPADLRARRTSTVTRKREGTSSMGRERLAAGGEAQRGGRHTGGPSCGEGRHAGGPSHGGPVTRGGTVTRGPHELWASFCLHVMRMYIYSFCCSK